MTRSQLEVVVSARAAADALDIMDWTVNKFGEAAAQRYEELIAQALIDLGEDPQRPGVKSRPELLMGGIFTYHLAFTEDAWRAGK